MGEGLAFFEARFNEFACLLDGDAVSGMGFRDEGIDSEVLLVFSKQGDKVHRS